MQYLSNSKTMEKKVLLAKKDCLVLSGHRLMINILMGAVRALTIRIDAVCLDEGREMREARSAWPVYG